MPTQASAPSRRPDVRRALIDALTPIVAQAGFDLEDVNVVAAGRRSVVRVIVDRDDGVDLDAVATVSRVVSEALDVAPASALIPGAYQLEVSSPGIDRPLTEPRQWRRASERLVAVDVDGVSVVGRVVSVDDSGVELLVHGVARAVPWSDLGSGRVQIEFNRAQTEEG